MRPLTRASVNGADFDEVMERIGDWPALDIADVLCERGHFLDDNFLAVVKAIEKRQRAENRGPHVTRHDTEPASMVERLEAATRSTDELIALPLPSYLIDALVPMDAITVLFAPPGKFKSFVAADWAMHTATGSWWNGREVVPGPVVYVVAESPAGMGMRVDAWKRHHGVYDMANHHPVHWLTLPPNLTDAMQTAALVEFCRRRAPVLVVIDTLARCTVGADENTAKDMGVVVEHAEQVRRATGAAVILVHHSGKDRGQGARGSNALSGAASAEIECSADDGRITLQVRKQKDARESAPIRLVAHPVELGEDEKGRPLSSVVVLPDRGQEAIETGLTANGHAVLAALKAVEVPGGVSPKVWLSQCEGVGERTFYNQRKRLLDLALVMNVGTDKAPKYMTAETLDAEAEAS